MVIGEYLMQIIQYITADELSNYFVNVEGKSYFS